MDNYRKTLFETAKTDAKEKADTQFNLCYGKKVVDALDGRYKFTKKLWQKGKNAKKDRCGETESGAEFATADAFVRGIDGRFYFIEFKNQPEKNVKYEELWNKAFESPLAVSFDLLADVPMKEVRKKAVFVVVYREDPMARGESQRSCYELIDMHRSSVVVGDKRIPIMFDLEKFTRGKFPIYSAIYTLTEKEFNDFSEQIFVP